MSETLNRMLGKVSDQYDTRAGSFIYDSLAPVAEELALIEDFLNAVKDKLIADNLSGDELTQRVLELGIERKEARYSAGIVTVTGTGTINEGDMFETPDGTQFQATETKSVVSVGVVAVSAVVAGVSGDVTANTITLFPTTLTGFTAVTNSNPTSGGTEKESDESLRTRYYLKVRRQPSTGNAAHYIQLAQEVSGIADARVFRAWNGPGTVKVVLLADNKRTPGATVVADVAALIEDNKPINADVTVVGVTEVLINISATITLKLGGDLTTAIEQIRATVGDYIRSLAFTDLIVRYTKIGEAILSADNVLDYSLLTVNNGTGNVELLQDQVPVMGAVNMMN